MKVLLVAVSALMALCAGCAGVGQSSGAGPVNRDASPSSTGAPTGQCALLDAATVQDLAGVALEGQETAVGGSNLSACAYGRLDGVGVQVAQVPASEWARALPGMVDQLKAMGVVSDPDLQRQLEEGKELVERGEAVPPDQACSLFRDMLRLQGVPAGSGGIVTYIPGREKPQAASVQACVDGTYTTIGVARPDLTAGTEQEAALQEALATIS